ncbi:hypothetical protein SARC_09275 [Sphaeroforma arctica JP610]|uniref:Uncharacterized protein n=1 Tax=Sphaeroforma arctica JP610 TaxID=667725 RepID=A0A0L0FNJ3_9EUKA|nr:hypothetical protein SARC_09275 [Sphaeroforma arctica JP610]KNC78289.1 hypothetical protein SARC_09275 [Sphaeroforma arctica JP610]|eukprot:XP_014152191.1 hypothetical protein SARC_09275 [Sphaeroforma arctica JP610]
MFRTPDAPATDVCKARSRVRPIVELTTPSGTPLKHDLFKTPEAKKDVKNKTERDDRTLAELQAQVCFGI